MSKKTIKKEGLPVGSNHVDPLNTPDQMQLPGRQQQVKMTIHEAIQMWSAQIDNAKNNLMRAIVSQGAEIDRLANENNELKKNQKEKV